MDPIKQSGAGGGPEAGEKVAHSILQLPHKILRFHDVDDLPQLILHELGHDAHFGLNKAAYLVDNPEFDCVKGIAGFDRCECSMHRENVWDAPHEFGSDMRSAPFYNSMKQFIQDMSIKRRDLDIHNPDDLAALGERLGLKNPSFFTWNMRHGNNGILLFEEGQAACAHHRDLLNYASALLSLC